MLGLGRPFVEVEGDPEIASQDIARNMRHHRNRAPRYIDAVDRAGVEMVGKNRVAGPVVGVLADPARTQNTTVTNLKQLSFQVIRHLHFSLR